MEKVRHPGVERGSGRLFLKGFLDSRYRTGKAYWKMLGKEDKGEKSMSEKIRNEIHREGMEWDSGTKVYLAQQF